MPIVKLSLAKRGQSRLVGALVALLAVVICAGSGRATADTPHGPSTRFSLANRCFELSTHRRFVVPTSGGYRLSARADRGERFFLKPTRLGVYMLYDRDRRLLATDGVGIERETNLGPPDEWAPQRAGRDTFSLRSPSTDSFVGIDRRSEALALGEVPAAFHFVSARGCTRFPEAGVDAHGGRPFRGTRPDGRVLGFADYHLHVTADMRAGGRTVYGRNFAPFGISQALGNDASVHGPSGALDVTGNLLRTGLPTGTHDTNGWPSFSGWPVFDTYTHQQTYYRWLQRAWEAGERLVVAQTVEDQPLCRIEPIRNHSCDETHTIELEIQRLRALERYVDAQSGGPGRGWFRIVTSPAQARDVIERGKLAVVIGMEASDPFGCSELLGVPQCDRADIDAGLQRLHKLGLRSMFVAHWVDNAFAGAALEPGATGEFISALQLSETGEPFQTQACPGPDEADGQCNVKGLTPLGRYLIRRLMAMHMLIDVDHLSEAAREQVLEIAAAHRYPLISSHTGTGGAWSPDQLRRLYALGGLATARLATAPQLADEIDTLAKFKSRRDYFGVGLGSDTGGFNSLPGPRADASSHPLRYPFRAAYCHLVFSRERSGTRTFDLNRDGVAHYGLVADLLADTRDQAGGRRALRLLFRSSEAYLEMWQRADARG